MQVFTSTSTHELSTVFEESRTELAKHTDAAAAAYKRWQELKILAEAQKEFHNFFVSFMKRFVDADDAKKQEALRTKYREKAKALIAAVEKQYDICYPGITKFSVKETPASPPATPEAMNSRDSMLSQISALKNLIDSTQKLKEQST